MGRRCGGALLPAPAAAVVLLDMTEPFVVANVVVRRWHLVGILLGLGLLVLFAVWGVRESGRGHRFRSRLGRILAGGITACCVVAGVLAFMFIALVDMVTTYTLLPQHSATGCRVLVSEHSVLLWGSGEIYVLPAGSHSPREVNGYTADDGYQPITQKTYRLTWLGEVAELTLWGTKDQPVSYASKPLSCE